MSKRFLCFQEVLLILIIFDSSNVHLRFTAANNKFYLHNHQHQQKGINHVEEEAISINKHRLVLLATEENPVEINAARIKVFLEWEIDFKRQTIIFELTAATTGYVGFGLKSPSLFNRSSSLSSLKTNDGSIGGSSRDRGMAHSDIVIGGIYPNGTSYFAVCLQNGHIMFSSTRPFDKDYHGLGNFAPVRDSSQDWDLHVAYENATHTFLRFGRQFDTCDGNEDVAIMAVQPMQILWALGSSDEIKYHGWLRGAVEAVILPTAPKTFSLHHHPEITVDDEDVDLIMTKKGYSSWKTIVNVEIKTEYAYRCTFHKGPRFNSMAHAVAFTPLISDPIASLHVHHFTFYQCKLPRSQKNRWRQHLDDDNTQDDIFEPWIAETNGHDCYSSSSEIPVRLCMQVLYVWGPGEKGMFFPEKTGYLLDEGEPFEPTYFMFEVHYESRGQLLNGIIFPVGVQVFYTEKLRESSAGFLAVAHAVSDTLFIPPHSQEFRIEGRCSSECTQRSVPTGGVTVISVMLHAHRYARKMKLRHFRNEKELPWLAVEHEFNFHSQKMKRVPDERKILPGDSLVVECAYNTLSRDTVTTGGFSSSFEMCTAFLWYFPKVNWDDCSSEFPPQILYEFFQYQQELTNDLDIWNKQPVPKPSLSAYVDSNVVWTIALRESVQQLLISSNHRASCTIPNDHQNFDVSNKPVGIAEPVNIQHKMVYQPTGSVMTSSTKNSLNISMQCKDKKI